MHHNRLRAVQTHMQKMGLRQLLISDPVSIKYLTGYYTMPYERFLGLLVFAEDPATTSAAAAPIIFVNELFPPVDGAVDRIISFSDTQNPLDFIIEHIDATLTLGVDQNLTARWLIPLAEKLQLKRGTKHASTLAPYVVLGSAAVYEARSVKQPDEQVLMQQASATNDAAIDWLKAQLKTGVTEIEIAEGLLAHYRSLGAEDFSFDPIVSFGVNNADPHHEPDHTRLAPGDVVLFDVGCKQDDYCADMTRCFFYGEPQDELARQIYDVVLAANLAAEKIVRPGVTFAELDRAARSVIEEAGFGPYFTHRLGHQIGLETHEPGDVSAVNHEPVRPGQIFSIEPGIYIPGKTGVRIEDLVLVTQDGCTILNRYSKEAEVIPVRS